LDNISSFNLAPFTQIFSVEFFRVILFHHKLVRLRHAGSSPFMGFQFGESRFFLLFFQSGFQNVFSHIFIDLEHSVDEMLIVVDILVWTVHFVTVLTKRGSINTGTFGAMFL
jgi:hypothetical protein